MCGSKPKEPTALPPPPKPETQSSGDDDIKVRGDIRKRQIGAMNSRQSIMGGRSDGKKTLLGE